MSLESDLVGIFTGAPLTATEAAQQIAGAIAANSGAALPPKAIIFCNLSYSDLLTYFATGGGLGIGPYAGMALCNGNNGTPNLADRFPRMVTGAAGGTGGSDAVAHDHTIDHDHGSFTSGAESAHTHSTPNHQHQTEIGWDSGAIYLKTNTTGGAAVPASGSIVESPVPNASVAITSLVSGAARMAKTRTDGAGTTGAGSSHTHSVNPPNYTGTSGAASNTENRPAYYQLTALMKL